MKCKRCGESFHPTDILVMENDEEPICSSCESLGVCYSFSCDGKDVVVCGSSFNEFLNKWENYQNRKQAFSSEEFLPERVEIRKIDYVITDD